MSTDVLDSQQSNQVVLPAAGFNIDAYNKVVAASNLIDIRLISSDCKVIPEYFLIRDQESREGKKLIELQQSATDVQVSSRIPTQGRGIASGRWKFRVSAVSGRKKLILINAEYLVVYEFHGEALDAEHVEYFVKKVGRVAVYPYFRQLVSFYSAAGHADLPVLPMLKEKPNVFPKAMPEEKDRQ